MFREDHRRQGNADDGGAVSGTEFKVEGFRRGGESAVDIGPAFDADLSAERVVDGLGEVEGERDKWGAAVEEGSEGIGGANPFCRRLR